MSFFSFWDSVFTFLGNYSLNRLIYVFWFLFFIEIPRYYILDIAVLLYRRIRRPQMRRAYQKAKTMLWVEKPLITILVPGKNEGENIYKLAMSLREQTYQNFETIIVDDGSDDFTPQICSDLERHGLITMFLRNAERGGKASAANMGFYYAKGKYVVHVDADSSLDRTALEEIIIPFYMDPEIKAVGGCIKVRNQNQNLCTALQAYEYLQTIMISRIVSSTIGIYRTVSGAFGAFESETLRRVGAWDIGPGLDGDITQKIRKIRGKIHFAEKAICLTNVPTKFYNLARQRLRWGKSLIRFRLRKHADVLIPNRNFNLLNFISNVENLSFNLILNVLWLFYLLDIIIGNANFIGELFIVKFFIMMVLGYVSFLIILSQTERKKEELVLILYVPLMSLYVGYFLRITLIYSYILEFFFFSSYKDPWNPEKTSRVARYEHI